VRLENLFKIKKIHCSYSNSTRPVLEIEDLIIRNNEVVFIIGPSGVGKSTVLETLGLMNQTTESFPDSEFTFCPKDEKPIDMSIIWKATEKELSNIRRKYFSFIFQSDNLFSSLTGYQNIIASSLIEGKGSNSAKRAAHKVLNGILDDLNSKENEDFSVNEMSGGQKQRLSFARAIISNYQVLFADEPTGNLDWYNAERMMEYLIMEIKKSPESSAIIVSHDVKLALGFADKIVYIDKLYDSDNRDKKRRVFYGKISNKSIFVKQDSKWHSASKTYDSSELETMIKEKFKRSENNNNEEDAKKDN